MNGQEDDALADDKPVRKPWTVKKLPIKGGSVLRSAILSENDHHTPEWVQVEGQIDG